MYHDCINYFYFKNQQPQKETAHVEENSIAQDFSLIKNGKKKKKKGNNLINTEFDLTTFPQDLVDEINLFRKNPQEYAEKIRSHIAYIKTDKDKLIYHNGDIKVSLNKGLEAFNNCIDTLLNCQALSSLQLNEEIKLEVPDDPEIQSKMFNKLQALLKPQYPGKKIGCNHDIAAPNPEVIVVLQLVDDNKSNGLRRNNLLDNAFEHLGVSIKKAKTKHYAIYLTFSD